MYRNRPRGLLAAQGKSLFDSEVFGRFFGPLRSGREVHVPPPRDSETPPRAWSESIVAHVESECPPPPQGEQELWYIHTLASIRKLEAERGAQVSTKWLVEGTTSRPTGWLA